MGLCADRQETIRVLERLRDVDDGALEEQLDVLIQHSRRLQERDR